MFLLCSSCLFMLFLEFSMFFHFLVGFPPSFSRARKSSSWLGSSRLFIIMFFTCFHYAFMLIHSFPFPPSSSRAKKLIQASGFHNAARKAVKNHEKWGKKHGSQKKEASQNTWKRWIKKGSWLNGKLGKAEIVEKGIGENKLGNMGQETRGDLVNVNCEEGNWDIGKQGKRQIGKRKIDKNLN